jgi:hypothetical protein
VRTSAATLKRCFADYMDPEEALLETKGVSALAYHISSFAMAGYAADR